MPDEQQEKPEAQNALVHPLDPDFLFVLFFAALIDILDFVFELGTLVNLVGGGLLIAWMTSKGGKVPSTKDIQQHQAQRQAAKAAVKKALRRGILIFIAELIPLLNLLPFWTIAVLAMLRQKSEPTPASAQGSGEAQPEPAVSPA